VPVLTDPWSDSSSTLSFDGNRKGIISVAVTWKQYYNGFWWNSSSQRILTLLMTAEYISIFDASELVEIRRNRFEGKFVDCCKLLYYSGITKIM